MCVRLNDVSDTLVGQQIKVEIRANRSDCVNKKEIENMLKNYAWMINSIKIMRKSLNDAGENLTAQYGEESAMPKGKGTTGDPIYRECLRREKRFDKIRRFEKKITEFQSLFYKITDERESEIFYWLLDGKSYRWIAEHMNLSHSHIQKLRTSIIEQLANTNDTKCTNDTNLNNGKHAC